MSNNWNLSLDPKRIAVIKIWNAMMMGARDYVYEQGFTEVCNAPEIVSQTGACENVDTLFKVDYFGRKAYLAQSDQLYIELLTPQLKKVFAVIQSFRAEAEADPRHLTQFSLFELELLGDLDDLIGAIAGTVKAMVDEVLEQCEEELKLLGRNPEDLRDLAFTTIRYEEAIEMIKDVFPELVFGDDLKANHEAEVAKRLGPVFITHYPEEIKFFNMKNNAEDPRVVNSTDLILPFSGESTGASERETNHDKLKEKLVKSAMYERLIQLGHTYEDFLWYLDAHKDKDIPLHSGCGIGMARVAQFIMGKEDIRECVPFLLNSENLL